MRDLADAIARVDPKVHQLLVGHLDDMGGELLITVFLADIARWAATPDASTDAIQKLCDLLEDVFVRGDATAKDIVGAGFVESLPAIDEPGGGILNHLGLALRQVAEDMSLTKPWHSSE